MTLALDMDAHLSLPLSESSLFSGVIYVDMNDHPLETVAAKILWVHPRFVLCHDDLWFDGRWAEVTS